MCEHFVAHADEPFRLDEVWPLVERLERFGVAGFGWGVAWLEPTGLIAGYRDVRAFRDDPTRDGVGATETTAALVHVRRPTRLSTISLADTQPFVDPAARFAFSHNGDLRRFRDHRARYRAEGRIHGRADSETGARWLEDHWTQEGSVHDHLGSLHEEFGGLANLAVIGSSGAVHHYAGNADNPVFTFRLGRLGIASTGIYSLDRSLFRFVAPGATDRRRVPLSTTATLGPGDRAAT